MTVRSELGGLFAGAKKQVTLFGNRFVQKKTTMITDRDLEDRLYQIDLSNSLRTEECFSLDESDENKAAQTAAHVDKDQFKSQKTGQTRGQWRNLKVNNDRLGFWNDFGDVMKSTRKRKGSEVESEVKDFFEYNSDASAAYRKAKLAHDGVDDAFKENDLR